MRRPGNGYARLPSAMKVVKWYYQSASLPVESPFAIAMRDL
jgi:hypothetical protein